VSVFFVRSRTTSLRKAIFQIHLWTGLAVCVWVVLVCTTGSALVFRGDMQQAMFPHLFTPARGAPADAATILERVREAFPGHRIYGIDGPTHERPTTIAYVAPPGEASRVVLIDPVTARILGQLPQRSFLTTVTGLHANLLAGRSGRIANGIGSLLLLLLCATGIVIWWPGLSTWRRGFTVAFRRNWRRVTWELHGAIGIWTLVFIAMWAATGVYFAAAPWFHRVLNVMSPLASASIPASQPEGANNRGVTERDLIVRAQSRLPDQYVHRLTPPGSGRDPFVMMFSKTWPAPTRPDQLTAVYLDQYTGELLSEPRPTVGSMGDAIVEWIRPVHYGTFGGAAVRVVWVVVGLSPAALAVTGFVMWWSRVIRPRWPKSGQSGTAVTPSPMGRS
jgi:uncharacterized iron-regulated membrane protein